MSYASARTPHARVNRAGHHRAQRPCVWRTPVREAADRAGEAAARVRARREAQLERPERRVAVAVAVADRHAGGQQRQHVLRLVEEAVPRGRRAEVRRRPPRAGRVAGQQHGVEVDAAEAVLHAGGGLLAQPQPEPLGLGGRADARGQQQRGLGRAEARRHERAQPAELLVAADAVVVPAAGLEGAHPGLVQHALPVRAGRVGGAALGAVGRAAPPRAGRVAAPLHEGGRGHRARRPLHGDAAGRLARVAQVQLHRLVRADAHQRGGGAVRQRQRRERQRPQPQRGRLSRHAAARAARHRRTMRAPSGAVAWRSGRRRGRCRSRSGGSSSSRAA